MKINQSHLLLLVSASIVVNAQAQMRETHPRSASATSPTRNYIEPTQDTGTIIRKDIKWNSKIPIDKTYGEFTPEQKEALHSMYESLAPGDEPAFPAEGIKPIFVAAKKAQHILQARGELNLVVTVGPDGNATKVEDFSNVHNTQMTEVMQQVLLLTKFKPAVCSGLPCTSQFRFSQKLKGG